MKQRDSYLTHNVMVKHHITDINIPELINDLWSLLTNDEKERLARNFQIQTYKKNQLVHSEDEVPTHLFCLLRGKVKVFREGVGGRNQIVRMIKPVEYFGFRAYFANETYVNAAAAVESSVVCSIPLSLIESLVKENINLACFFIRNLSRSLGVADRRTVNLTQKHIRGRLAESLLFLKESYGLEEDNSTLSIYLSREDLANLSNMTTSNAIRTLSQFASEKLIAIDGRKIKIIEEDKLKKISKIG